MARHNINVPSGVDLTPQESALLAALGLVRTDVPMAIANRAPDEIGFLVQLIVRATARNQDLPDAIEALNLDDSDVLPLLVLQRKLLDA